MTRKLHYEGIGNLSPETVVSFLRADSWVPVQSKRHGIWIFRKNFHDRDWEVVLPSKGFSDYEKGMRDALEVISGYQGKDVADIVEAFSRPLQDTLRFRVDGPSTKRGTIPLRDGIQLLEGAKALLLSAASDEEHPLPFHDRNAYKQGLELLRMCEIGQTEYGSFAMKLIVPVSPEVNNGGKLNLEDGAEGFGRKVTQRLMRSVNTLANSSRSLFPSLEIESRQTNSLMSANFVDAVANLLLDAEDNRVEISIENSTLLPAQKEVFSGPVSIDGKWASGYRELAKRLRTSTLIATGEFLCSVKRLEANPKDLERGYGEVVVLLNLEGKEIQAKISLGKSNYIMAAQAHLAGAKLLVNGELRYSGRYKTINLKKLEVLY